VLSAAQTVCAATDDAGLARRAAATGQSLDALRSGALAGTPAEIVAKIGQFAEIGAERIYLQIMDLTDLDHLELLAAEVLPHV
jgi:alkanesulfonate monooxygenase SsuD/methylene tetrahydromethanopterin reductase-like flavin-dependent oxidoreductase (luciferase family)